MLDQIGPQVTPHGLVDAVSFQIHLGYQIQIWLDLTLPFKAILCMTVGLSGYYLVVKFTAFSKL